LPNNNRTIGTIYSEVVIQAASIVTLASCVTGQMTDMAIFFLLGRNILFKRYSISAASSPTYTSAAATSGDTIEAKKGLPYNSGIGTPRSKNF
jgi:hypothetical protein